MQTIEFTIDETLLAKLDQITSKLSVTRAAFIQQLLEAALQQQEVLAQERRHAEGYARHPVQPGEFDGWENVRVWEQP
ncbi:MAG: CopG family transcriptional regulator [Acidobacteria bacterium]|nr:CopG family transcriptional regulator [Acidobacteriota bacterium]